MEFGEFGQQNVADKGFWAPSLRILQELFRDEPGWQKDMKTGKRGTIERTLAFVWDQRRPRKRGHCLISDGLPGSRLVQWGVHSTKEGMAGTGVRKLGEISQKCNVTARGFQKGKEPPWGQ